MTVTHPLRRPVGAARAAAAAILPSLALLGCAGGPRDGRSADRAAADLDIYPGLEAVLFASEPMLSNPVNIDIDHRGRVWVCDVVNYRERAANNDRPAGDRILILADEDGDGAADSSKVYYQGRDIDAALGIAVLGNRTIVTAAPNVIVFTDEDGDDKPDRKEYLFTNSGAPQNDHSTHSVVFGPDGKLYWNMGNGGRYVGGKDGRLMIDRAGNPVLDRNYVNFLRENPQADRPAFARGYENIESPYQGGMVFRADLDGGGFEVLGHNFRNNYEAAVDSFGGVWQSDNDDDGNYAVRLNYILEFGNYGYRDEMTGAGNQAPRTGRSEKIPERHWHRNDPGVVPNLLIAGAGSPTGIAVYEGRLLPRELWDRAFYTDAGPGVLRAVLAEPEGAGYTARTVDILKGERDKWVRPVDVAAAPDGSLFVSDWYDPVIGWNRMEDAGRGRIFRIAPPGNRYEPGEHDFTTAAGAAEALKSPNQAARYMAWTALRAKQKEAEPVLAAMFAGGEPRMRARALWLLSKFDGRGGHYVGRALDDADENMRIVGLRAARQLGLDPIPLVERLAADPSPRVRRECAIALRGLRGPAAATLWAALASRHDGADRWYLEALGIAAEGRWNACLRAWLKRVGPAWNSPAGRDIVWRSRADATPDYLARILRGDGLEAGDAARYLRAFDFQKDSAAKSRNLRKLAFGRPDSRAPGDIFIAAEALLRLPEIDLAADPGARKAVAALLDRAQGTEQFARLALRYKLREHYPALMAAAVENKDNPLGIASVAALLEADAGGVIEDFIRRDPQAAADAAEALGNSRSGLAAPLLEKMALDASLPAAAREQAVRSMAGIRQGAETLIALAKAGAFPQELRETAGAAMTRSMHARMRAEAERLFPLPPMRNNEPLPGMTDLLVLAGNAERGAQVFESATCADCHIVGGKGVRFGPDLSKIGEKLSKAGLYESILDPSAGVSPDFRLEHFELAGNELVSGIVVNETADKVTLRMEGGAAADYAKQDILSRRESSVSAMPDDLQEQMSVDDLVDLVEYLSKLR